LLNERVRNIELEQDYQKLRGESLEAAKCAYNQLMFAFDEAEWRPAWIEVVAKNNV
jgi:hypothetical protein